MTYVFGGFGPDFYDGYESEWPLPEVSSLSAYDLIFLMQ